MKAHVISLVTAAMLAGCALVPFRYDGPDAATLAGEYETNKSLVVEVNGQRREVPFLPGPITVRPGLLRVGVHLHNGGLFGAECFEVQVEPGSYYQFSAAARNDGFVVSLYEGRGESRKLIGTTFAPFRSMSLYWDKERCPTAIKS